VKQPKALAVQIAREIGDACKIAAPTEACDNIPIVFLSGNDPVRVGLWSEPSLLKRHGV
jgi:hypothetical protein